MQKVNVFHNTKQLLIAGAVSLILALGLAISVSGSASAYSGDENCTEGSCNTENTDNSNTTSVDGSGAAASKGGTAISVSGDCSGVFNVQQSNNASSSANSSSSNGGGSESSANSSANSSTGSQSNGVSFSPDCSTTNVTHAAKQAAQVKHMPKGAVHAGAGGAVEANTGLSAIVGLVGSAGVMAAGVVLRRQFEM